MNRISNRTPWPVRALLSTAVVCACLACPPTLAAAANDTAKEELASLAPVEPLAEDVVKDGLEVSPFTPRARRIAPKRPNTLYVTGETLAEQVHCLALNIYFEARSETHRGKKAVAAVTINRLRSTRFPTTICEVVRQGGDESLHRCQFSWWCDGRSDKPRDGRSWRTAVSIAETVLRHGIKDPTRGALWYHADYVRPVWRREKRRVAVIGRHIFYVDRRGSGRAVVEARR